MQISTYKHYSPQLYLNFPPVNASLLNDRMHYPLHATMFLTDLTWQAAVHLTLTYGYNSVAPFALDQNKQIFFSSTGKAFISYVLQRDVALVIGDPIGPTGELSLVLAEFLAFWRVRHKAVAFWQTREELLDLYRSQGLHALKIGEDTIIDVQNFTLKGGKMANVRSCVRRGEKSGLRVVFYEGEVSSVCHREQMARISQAWLVRKGGREMGFSMSHFEPAAGRLTALAVDPQDNVQAFITFLPIYGRNGWGLDLLRRSEHAVPGTMELLLVCSLEQFKERGNAMMSLGLAPLGNDNQSQLSLLGRCSSLLLRHSSTLQQFQSLTAFKRKFQPTWENRYLIFSHPAKLLQIGFALHAAHHRDHAASFTHFPAE